MIAENIFRMLGVRQKSNPACAGDRKLPRCLITLIACLTPGPLAADTLSTDCIPPLRPELAASPDLLRDYGDDIRAEFDSYFDEAQAYLNCQAAASASAQAEIRLVLNAYKEMFQ